jgi:hypothetical protein
VALLCNHILPLLTELPLPKQSFQSIILVYQFNNKTHNHPDIYEEESFPNHLGAKETTGKKQQTWIDMDKFYFSVPWQCAAAWWLYLTHMSSSVDDCADDWMNKVHTTL